MKLRICLLALACLGITMTHAADAETNQWESSIAAGLTVTRGNSDTLLATMNFLTAKKWYQNELRFGADATYGESEFTRNGDSETEVTAQNFRAYGQYNRLFHEKMFGYFRMEGLHDEVADVDYRFTVSPGAGYYFVKNTRTFLSLEVGPGYVVEKQGGVTDDYVTLRVAERFEHKLNARAKVWQSLEFLPQVDDWDNFLINAEIGIETAISKNFSLRTYLQDTYDNQPAPGRDENDLKVVAAVAYKF